MNTVQTVLERLELLHRIAYFDIEKEDWVSSLQQILEYRSEVAKHYLKNDVSKEYDELLDYCNMQIKKLLSIW